MFSIGNHVLILHIGNLVSKVYTIEFLVNR
jgi:hypothetical protein